eukprot:2401336-Prorocentrum_lima.AAC.1
MPGDDEVFTQPMTLGKVPSADLSGPHPIAIGTNYLSLFIDVLNNNATNLRRPIKTPTQVVSAV